MTTEKLPIPEDVRTQPPEAQMKWLEKELPVIRKAAVTQLMRQVVLTMTLAFALIVPIELLSVYAGWERVEVRVVGYFLILLLWNYSPWMKRWNAVQANSRKIIRELELYRVFLTARLLAPDKRKKKDKN